MNTQKEQYAFFHFVLFKLFAALHGVEDRISKHACRVCYIWHLLAKGLLPVEFKFRSAEILRKSVMKGELWIFLFWKLSLLNSTNDSIQLYSHLTRDTRIATWIASSSRGVIPSFSVIERLPGTRLKGLVCVTATLFSPVYYYKSCLVAYLPKEGC